MVLLCVRVHLIDVPVVPPLVTAVRLRPSDFCAITFHWRAVCSSSTDSCLQTPLKGYVATGVARVPCAALRRVLDLSLPQTYILV